MYENYAATGNHDRDGPECSTYPRSVGRLGNSSLFSRRWDNRVNRNLQPIRMKWNLDDENEEESPTNPPEGSGQLTDSTNESTQKQDESVNEKEDDDHSDPSISGSHKSHHENMYHFTEATYPTSRPIHTGAYAFSSHALSQKGESNEATPWKCAYPMYFKTEEKRRMVEVSDAMSLKTPLPERSVTEEDGNLCSHSGTELVGKKSLNGVDKSSVRGLFTPVLSENVPVDPHDLLDGFKPIQNKLPDSNHHITFRKPIVNMSTPLLPKSKVGNHQLQNKETSMKTIPLERTDIMELVKIHKSEKKCGRNGNHIESILNEANKENVMCRVSLELGSLHGPKEKEKDVHKLNRSLSHASLLKDDIGKTITPSKEDRPTSAKSLSNLFNATQVSASKLAQQASRIPTPTQSHTPQKQNPQTPVSTSESVMETSCVEMLDFQMPMKFPHGINKEVIMEQEPLPAQDTFSSLSGNIIQEAFVGASLGQPNHATSHHTLSCPQADGAQDGHGNSCSNKVSNQGLHLTVNSRHMNFSNAPPPHTRSSTFSLTNAAICAHEKPSCIFQSAAKSLEAQCSVSQSSSSVSISSSVTNSSAFAIPDVPRKPFSLKPPSFNPPPVNNDLNPSTKISIGFTGSLAPITAAPQKNLNHFHVQSSLPQPQPIVESHIQSHRQQLHPLCQKEENKRSTCSQNSKVNYLSVSSQPVDRQPVHPNIQTTVCGPVNTQQPACGPLTFTQSTSNSMEVNCVPTSQQPISMSNNRKLQNGNAVITEPMLAAVPPSAENKLSIPAEAHSQPMRKVVTSVRPISLQSNRKILVVNKKHYEVLRLLGKGASSKVYDVLDCQTNHCVAVKRVVLRQDDASVEGYLKEVELLNQLRGSECIIRLIDSEICLEKEYKVLYMVLERGEMDLSISIKLMSMSGPKSGPGQPSGKIPTVTIIYYWVSMLNAVDEIHQKGIVHSDLKPANFLLVGGKVKLIDFGIATAVQVDMTSVVKDDPAGTPNYMSPEAIGLTVSGSPNSQDMFKNPKASYKSDVWSLGCILYSLVYGRSPFQHIMNERMKLDAICNCKYGIPFPSSSSVHTPLLRAMKRCLVRNYKERASIAELKSIDYLCGNELDEESWDSWKAMAADRILAALSPECRMQVVKVIQEVFKSPPRKKNLV